MAKRRSLEDTLAALGQLRTDPTSPAALAQLRDALKATSSHVAAKAARIAGECELAALAPDLVAAFRRFMTNPVKADPGCRAKAAIAEALYRIGDDHEDLFLQGIRYVQPEPAYGGKADTAQDLRAACALGLVRMNSPEALSEVADLLADAEAPVRIAAARAVAYSENPAGAPLLRLKIRVGDDEPQVIAECLSALLQLTPEAGVAFVARLLDRTDATLRESAALALGGSRLPAAFAVLRDWWERTADPPRRRTALLAIAMLRRDAALDFLVGLVAEADGPTAREAIAALALHRHDDALRQRVCEVVERRQDVDLHAALSKAF